MSKSQVIKRKCLDCAGGSPKEVTLCLVFDCPNWPHRFGCSYKSKVFLERMRSARRRWPQDYQVMVEELRAYIKKHPFSAEYAQIADVIYGIAVSEH